MSTPEDTAAAEPEVFRDELGVRYRRIDATGVPTDVLRVCRDLAPVGRAIADRFDRLVTLRLAHFVPLRSAGSPADGSGGFEVVSDAQYGVRLSRLLAAARDGRLAISGDAALQVVRQLLAAVAALHESRGIAHGVIGPERILIAPRGHVVLTDHIYGSGFERLGLSRARLWGEFRVPTPPRPGTPALDAQTDVGQIGLVALALLAGRPLAISDYPDRVPSMLDALTLGAAEGPAVPLSRAMRTWMNGVLPVGTGIRFETVRHAQMALEAALEHRRSSAGAEHPLKRLVQQYERAVAASDTSHVPGTPPDKRRLCQAPVVAARSAGTRDAWQTNADGPAAPVIQSLAASSRETATRPKMPTDGCCVKTLAEEIATYPPAVVGATPETTVPRPTSIPEEIEASGPPPVPPPLFGQMLAERECEHEPVPRTEPPPPGVVPGGVARAADAECEPVTPPVQNGFAAPASPASEHEPAGPVARQRPHAVQAVHTALHRFGQRLNGPTGAAASLLARVARRARLAGLVIIAAGVRASTTSARRAVAGMMRIARAASAAAIWACRSALHAGRVVAGSAMRLVVALVPTIRRALRSAGRRGVAIARRGHAQARRTGMAAAGALTTVGRTSWRIGGAAAHSPGVRRLAGCLLAVLLVSSGLRYADGALLVRARALAGQLLTAAGPTDSREPPREAVSPATGAIRVLSQPDGAAVWLDGVERGRAPLELAGLSEGDHTVTLRGAAGTVRTSVHVQAGETQDVLVPIYPGWLAVFAPVELQIAEGGVVIGTTESGRLMAAPGPHTLELTSTILGFRTTRIVDVTPGAVAAVNVTLPPVPLAIAAPAGAEVWIDGTFVGRAPVPARPVPVGTRVVLVRQPSTGEQQATVTVSYRGANQVVFASREPLADPKSACTPER
jgi:hypothetical protein